VRIRLHEGILHRLVRLGHIAEVVIRDPPSAPLVPGDELGIALPRLGMIALSLQALDRRRRRRIRFPGGRECGWCS